MTVLYFYGDNKAYDHSQVYVDDTQVPNPLPSNSTVVAPEQGLYGTPKWNGTTWVGIARDEWLTQQPATTPVAPTNDEKFQAQLALQMATLQKNQAEFNAQVLLQLADLKESVTPTTSPASSATPAATSAAAETPVTSATPTATSTASTVENK
ncbi:hypothetical protein [Lactiplantibacillus plantarum]|uniref:hypothetical protein n=1 Tax=Lactiplantibacillus plantarum TaxID=1590 RepID=UPI00293D14AE|nr:hypothetical protein [Lactiplantibacillus plantarum]MDV3526139.1 hypothetical protein [Lactiplantibacillus plantarum]